MTALGVSELNTQIKSLLESTFQRVSVEGEVSNVTYHGSGHLYFSLKDDKSTIRCVMFKGNVSKMKFRLEAGQHILIDAALSVYMPRGEYQLNCFSAIPAGTGALALAYEQLKKKLEAKGYFDPSRKKPLPRFPKRVILITSATGAAIQDMRKVASKRWPLVQLVLIPTQVQGEGAAAMIARHIDLADRMEADAMVVGRGGGSLEDLWAFNEEVVAEAIYRARTPVVSAVGHEVDYVISDFVADVRGATPSAAMELLLPDQVEMMLGLDQWRERFSERFGQLLGQKQEQVVHLRALFARHGFSERLRYGKETVTALRSQLYRRLEGMIRLKRQELETARPMLKATGRQWLAQKRVTLVHFQERCQQADPARRVRTGWAQVVKDGNVTGLETIFPGERFELSDAKILVEAEAKTVRKL